MLHSSGPVDRTALFCSIWLVASLHCRLDMHCCNMHRGVNSSNVQVSKRVGINFTYHVPGKDEASGSYQTHCWSVLVLAGLMLAFVIFVPFLCAGIRNYVGFSHQEFNNKFRLSEADRNRCVTRSSRDVLWTIITCTGAKSTNFPQLCALKHDQ